MPGRALLINDVPLESRRWPVISSPAVFGPVILGLISAALFGLATPLSKLLLGSLSQFQLAGLLYLGAGIGMVPLVAWRRGPRRRRISRENAIRIVGAVLLGGGAAPVLMLSALTTAQASSVSLWLNLELAATAVLGALFFKDHLGRLGWIGVGGALAAGVLVTIGEGSAGILPALFIFLACACWGLDNNLTSLIDGLTPQEITLIKGFAAGAVNLLIGTLAARSLPAARPALASLALGAACYGGSIALYIACAQRIGAARGQIVFASAPFLGAAFSLALLAETPSVIKLAAAAILIGAIATIRQSSHAHRHRHEKTTHIHLHRHDDMHHSHEHPGLPPSLTHTHEHAHGALDHEHAHLPDLHHRHSHDGGKP